MKDKPIKLKLRRVIMQTSGAVLLLTCSAYFVYEFVTFRQTSVRELSTLGKIIASNSTAALAFDAAEDAAEILSALKAEPHIVSAALYNKNGKLFSFYPAASSQNSFPQSPEAEGYNFREAHLIGFQEVKQGDRHLGVLYLKSDMGAMYERLRLYGVIALSVIMLSFLLAYVLSKKLQRVISNPILGLAQTARAVSERHDYTVRAEKIGNDEIGTLTDAFNHMLTQIEKQRTEIQLFNQKLEENIKERTLELESANKELESFSYSVSHDLRAPLRSIDGYSRVLIEDYGDKIDDEGKRILGIITRNALRMGQLIDDLLSFSRIGKQNLIKVNLDMDFITMLTTEDIKSQNKKPIEFIIKPMLGVQGDSSMMKQVMENLVSNAVKYSMKKEKPVIEIGSFSENGNNVYYVKDNGAGFDMQYYNKLFGVFQRLHNNHDFEGTGVGLALVHRIISKHGGNVWAEGKEGVGATFYFSLPVEPVTKQKNKVKHHIKPQS
jgi:signal transduction histidine kinase